MKTKPNTGSSIKAWQKSIIQDAKFKVMPINLEQSKEWEQKNGVIEHKSGRFFRIVGIQGKVNKKVITQPLIEQWEVGTLGFLIHKNADVQILVQAKIEPGNVDVCQLAPTYQATASNAAQAHGGTVPPYKDIFSSKDQKAISSTLNSEQGTRFLEKLNLNTIIESETLIEPTKYHRWVSVEDFLDLLAEDHMVNTDARSVIVSAPWKQLLTRKPFSRFRTPFASALQKSYKTSRPQVIEKLKKQLTRAQELVQEPTKIDIDKLPGWQITPRGLKHETDGHFTVEHIKVNAYGREVAHWDQPIINSTTDGQVVLLCGRQDGQLVFLICFQEEVGLLNKVELGPSVFCVPGSNQDFVEFKDGKVLRSVFQSDEGGRFFRDTTLYQIIDIGEITDKQQKGYWLTLGEIAQLLEEGGYFTNEARSVLSLLMPWL